MWRAVFRDWNCGTNSSGYTKRLEGDFLVCVDLIKEGHAVDCMFPMKAGQWGAFRENELCPDGHSPYAFATGKTAEEAKGKCRGFFKSCVIYWSEDMEQFQSKESSNIGWARYDPSTRVLEVDFKNAKTGLKTSTYAYDEFPAEEWAEFNAATTKGQHFAYRIRPRYTGRKLGAPAPASKEPDLFG